MDYSNFRYYLAVAPSPLERSSHPVLHQSRLPTAKDFLASHPRTHDFLSSLPGDRFCPEHKTGLSAALKADFPDWPPEGVPLSKTPCRIKPIDWTDIRHFTSALASRLPEGHPFGYEVQSVCAGAFEAVRPLTFEALLPFVRLDPLPGPAEVQALFATINLEYARPLAPSSPVVSAAAQQTGAGRSLSPRPHRPLSAPGYSCSPAPSPGASPRSSSSSAAAPSPSLAERAKAVCEKLAATPDATQWPGFRLLRRDFVTARMVAMYPDSQIYQAEEAVARLEKWLSAAR